MAATEQDLIRIFEKLGINYTLYRHEPFFTVEDSRKAREDWPGGHCKCLFLKDKKRNMVLVIAHEDTRVDLKKLAQTLGLGRFSFGSAELLGKVLKVKPGAVTPFAVMNLEPSVRAGSFQTVLDKALQGYEVVHFHPLHNEATAAIAFSGLISFLEHFKTPPKIMDIG